MPESSPATRPPKDPVRIVYHAGNRTFARLFNERSLEELEHVVRNKLGLGVETDVLLKQMGSGTLLDLDDDGDFQAFRVLLNSSVSADIQVTVGPSLGPAAPPPVIPPRDGPPPAIELATGTSEVSPSKETPGATISGPLNAQPDVTHTAKIPTVRTETELSRKRRALFARDVVAISDEPQHSESPDVHRRLRGHFRAPRKPMASPPPAGPSSATYEVQTPYEDMEQHAQTQPIAITPIASAEIAESSTSKPDVISEPPKKRQRKAPTKRKEVQSSEVVDGVPQKSSTILNVKDSVTFSKVGPRLPNNSEAPEPLPKKQTKSRKDIAIDKKKSAASANKDGMDQPVTQPRNLVDGTAPRAGSTCPAAVDETFEARKSDWIVAPKGTVCAAIPQTSASTSVRSEVAAAILSGYLSKTSETVLSASSAKRRPVRRVSKKSSALSNATPMESTPVLDAAANKDRDLPAEHSSDQVASADKPPPQTLDLEGPPCPICLGEPFHIRYCCPTVLEGPDAIRERLQELKMTNMVNQQTLIKQLEDLLRDSEVTPGPPLDVMSIDNMQSEKVSSHLSASRPGTPHVPNVCLAEVTVESRDEGSSSESSDDTSQEEPECHELLPLRRQKTSDEQPAPSDSGLEATIRGPVSTQKSILGLIDRIVANEGSSSEEDDARLEEDTDEEPGPSTRRYLKHVTRSSDSESDAESSRSPSSPSSSRSDNSDPNNHGPGVQGLTKSSNGFTEGDVDMADSINPPILEQDDSNDETHVGPEDRMATDEPTGKHDATIVAKEQVPSPIPGSSDLRPSDLPTTKTQAESTSNEDAIVPGAPEVLEEVEADPIEPADDSTVSRLTNADPIEVRSEGFGSLFPSASQSTPKPGVSSRIKTRNGQILANEAERPVLLERLETEAADEVTPIPAKGRLRKKVTETPASQELTSRRRSLRFSSVPPSTSTPAATALLNGRTMASKTKTPAMPAEEPPEGLKSSCKDSATQEGDRVAITPSLDRWETLRELSSPSVQVDEPVHVDELMSSSPQPDNNPARGRPNNNMQRGRPRKSATAAQAESSREKQRLFDLTPSQIPFPYSQQRINLLPTPLLNGKQSEETTDSEEEAKLTKERTKVPVQYRPLSQLASQAIFSPSLPTTSSSNKFMTNGKTKKRGAEDSSSPSSSDEDEANGLEHIPRGRRAGSVLQTKKRKRLLSRI